MSGLDEGPAGRGGAMDRGVAASFLAELDREIAAVEARLAELRDLRAVVERLIGRSMSDDGPVGDAPPPPRRHPSASRPSLTDLVADVLRESRAPISIKEMRGPLRARGYGGGMEDMAMYNSIYTTLKRRGHYFVRDGVNRWSLTEVGWRFARTVTLPPLSPDDGRGSPP